MQSILSAPCTQTLRGAASRLGWDARTLVKWMRRAGVEPAVPPTDSKRRLLTPEQVDAIAAYRTEQLGDTGTSRVAELEAEVARLRTLLDAGSTASAYLADHLRQPSAPALLPTRHSVVTRRLPQPEPSDTLPAGWVSMHRIGDLHGKQHATVKYRIDHRHITVEPGGPWKWRGTIVRHALGEEGQRQFHELYPTAPYNAECPYCRAHGSPRYD